VYTGPGSLDTQVTITPGSRLRVHNDYTKNISILSMNVHWDQGKLFYEKEMKNVMKVLHLYMLCLLKKPRHKRLRWHQRSATLLENVTMLHFIADIMSSER
jgi:hypothetical protein